MKHLLIISLISFSGLSGFGQAWSRLYDFGMSENGYEIIALSDGNLFVCGKQWGFENYSSKYLFLKVNTDGDILWQKILRLGHGGGSYSNIFPFELEEDKGLLIIGNTYEAISDASYGDLFFLRLDSSGDSLSIRYTGTENIEILSSTISSGYNDSYILHYMSRIPASNVTEHHLMQVDKDGEIISQSTFDPGTSATFYSLTATPDSNILISGFSSYFNNTFKALILKTDINGNIDWTREYGLMEKNFFFDADISQSGTPVFFGSTGGSEPRGYSIVFTDWDGNVLDERRIHSPRGGILALPHPRLECLRLQDKDFLLITEARPAGTGESDSKLFWIDSAGDSLDAVVFGGPDDWESLMNAVQTPDRSIFVTGGNYNDSDGSDLSLVKFDNLSGIRQDQLTAEHEMLCHPNPFSESFTLLLNEATMLPAELDIIDVRGNVISHHRITEQESTISPSVEIPGSYFLRITDQNTVSLSKVVKY